MRQLETAGDVIMAWMLLWRAAIASQKLAGKDAAFIKQQLMDFKSGKRQNPTMNAMAAMLNEADMANVAAYLSAQK